MCKENTVCCPLLSLSPMSKIEVLEYYGSDDELSSTRKSMEDDGATEFIAQVNPHHLHTIFGFLGNNVED